MNFVEAASALLKNLDPMDVAPGFIERLNVAEGPISDRTISTPFYLTDLGVRRFDDPSLFLNANLKLIGTESLSDPECDLNLSKSIPAQGLGDFLDSYILIVGDYDFAARVVIERMGDILVSGNANTLISAGVLAASIGDVSARDLLFEAANSSKTPMNRFMALHRLAAAEIKRFNAPSEGIAILERIENEIASTERDGIISIGDAEALRAVVSNLRALAWIRLKDFKNAVGDISRSMSIHTTDELRTLTIDESARYGAQIRINVAQTQLQRGLLEDGVQTLTENVAYCRANSIEYVGEALSALSYGLYIAGDYRQAISTANDAASEIAFQASPTRLRAARNIAIASLAKLDDLSKASAYLEIANNDVLGLQYSRPNLQWQKVA